MGLHVLVYKNNFKNDQFILRLLEEELLERLDVSPDQVYEKMISIGQGRIVDLLKKYKETFDPDKRQKIRHKLNSTAAYQKYTDALNSFPLNIEKIRRFVAFDDSRTFRGDGNVETAYSIGKISDMVEYDRALSMVNLICKELSLPTVAMETLKSRLMGVVKAMPAFDLSVQLEEIEKLSEEILDEKVFEKIKPMVGDIRSCRFAGHRGIIVGRIFSAAGL